MSTATADTATTTPDRDRVRRALPALAAVTMLVTAFFTVARSDTAAEAGVVIAFDLVVLALVFALVVAPGLRQEGAGVRGIVLGALGLLTLVPAFWSGLPM